LPEINTKIWLAARKAVEALQTALAIDVAYPGTPYTSDPEKNYVRFRWVPNNNFRFLVSSGPHQRRGLLLLDVFAEKRQDASVGIEIAGQVAARFGTDSLLVYDDIALRVYKAPDVAQPMDDVSHTLIPVSVSYEVYA
jgi:hypothetical protein